MKCQICGQKINQQNNGFSNLLVNEEKKRFLKLKKKQTICLECKTDLLFANIITPY